MTLLPAAPGFYLLDPIPTDDGGVEGFWRVPIIAWRVVETEESDDADTFDVVPVTLMSAAGHPVLPLILAPDGGVTRQDFWWESSEGCALTRYRADVRKMTE